MSEEQREAVKAQGSKAGVHDVKKAVMQVRRGTEKGTKSPSAAPNGLTSFDRRLTRCMTGERGTGARNHRRMTIEKERPCA
jgi:hypothetical protein